MSEPEKLSDEAMRQSLDAARQTPDAKVPGVIGNVASQLRPSAKQSVAKQVSVDDAFPYETAFRLSFLGAGQAGGRIAQAFYELGYRRVAALNTTDMDFRGLDDAIVKLNLGVGGAGKDPEFAAAQLQGREEEVWDLLTRGWGDRFDYGILCVGLGGGTGSGTAPVLVEIARRYMESHGRPAKVGAVVSLPTTAEGPRQARNCVRAFQALLKLGVSPLVVIDNGLIHELYNRPAIATLYPKANGHVSTLLHLFNQLSAVHSEHITFDRSEFAQLLDGGVVVMGAADLALDKIQSPADISVAIRDELANNLLAKVDLRTGQTAACLFVGSPEALDTLSLDFFEAGFGQLNRTVGSTRKGHAAVIHRGLYLGTEAGLQVYTMVSGVQPPNERLAQLAKAGMMDEALGTPKGVAAFLGVQD